MEERILQTNQSYNEQELLSRLAARDEKVFRYCYDRFYTPLVYFANDYISLEEAEDVVVTVFTRLWQSLGNREFATLTTLKNFLYVSTRNACLDVIKLRSRQRAREKEAYDAWYETAELEPAAHLAMYEAELLNHIYEAIAQLPPKCRDVFTMSYLQGKSTQEIADALQITPSTVFNQKARAIQLLKLSFVDKNLFLLLFYYFL